MLRSRLSRSFCIAAAGLLAAACGESTQQAVTAPEPRFDGGTVTDAPHITVCKHAASGTFSFTVSQNMENGTLLQGSNFDLAGGSCVDVWQDNGYNGVGIDPPTEISISETGLPEGWQLLAVQLTDQTVPPSTCADTPPAAGNTITLRTNFFHGCVVTFVNQELPRGCTPGYWKQRQHEDSWPPAELLKTLNDVFSSATGDLGDVSLQDALKPQRLKRFADNLTSALIRHGVAAYLNSLVLGVDYALTTAEVVDLVNLALDSGSDTQIETNKNLLASNNEGFCPLN